MFSSSKAMSCSVFVCSAPTSSFHEFESGGGNEALVFITDLALPNVNGLNLVTRIHRRWPNMPIVLVTLSRQLRAEAYNDLSR